MSDLIYQEEDISISLAGTWSSKLQTVSTHSCGGLTKNLEPSRIGITRDGHGISILLEEAQTCKLGTLTQDGGNFSDGAMSSQCSSMSRTARFLMFLEAEMKKVAMFKSGERMAHLLKDGLLSTLMKTKQR